MPHVITVDQPTSVNLKSIETDSTGGLQKDEAVAKAQELGKEMEELFDLLFYSGKNSLLIVLQGMDTSGKDGTIKHILNFSNAQSCKVAPFKVPTPLELAHDFLWRVHSQAPPKGGITIFNRSHYEDVLVVRVHDLVPKDVWKERFDMINAFEHQLASSGTVVLKFFLHISKTEQEERLLDREKDVEKSWKLSVGDWEERELWDEYQKAYEDAIGKCASKAAPWHIVPADHKWYRNLAVTKAILDRVRPLKKEWMADLKSVGDKAKAELEAFRQAKQKS